MRGTRIGMQENQRIERIMGTRISGAHVPAGILARSITVP